MALFYPYDMSRETEDFHRFVAEMATLSTRSEITIEEIPAPQKLAPFSYAVSADAVLENDDEIATGRFVILHDPEGQTAWEGHFRCVTFIRSAIDADMQSDPLLPDVGWSWFIESLEKSGANYLAPSGTVTRVSSASFGQLVTQEPNAEIEIRASWTPSNSAELMKHVAAWLELLAIAAGLSPLPDGVSSLPKRR